MGGINIPSGKMTVNPIRLHSFICAWVAVVQLSRPVGVFRKWIQAITVDRCESLDSCCRLDHGLCLLRIYEGDDTYNRLWWSITIWVVKNLAVSFVCFQDRVNKTMAFESSVKAHPGFAWVKKLLDNFGADEASRNLALTLSSSISSIVSLFLSKAPGEYVLSKRDLICFIMDEFCGFANHHLIFDALRNDVNRVDSICPS